MRWQVSEVFPSDKPLPLKKKKTNRRLIHRADSVHCLASRGPYAVYLSINSAPTAQSPYVTGPLGPEFGHREHLADSTPV